MLMEPGDGGGFAGITEAVAELKTASSTNGGFTITDDGAQTLINALTDVHTQVLAAIAKGGMLGTEPKLGTTPAANAYKSFLASVWSDGTQGGQTALTQLQQDLQDAIDTLHKNSASYKANEQQIHTTLT